MEVTLNKKRLCLSLAITAWHLFAIPSSLLAAEPVVISREEVVEEAPRDVLFARALKWFQKVFRGPRASLDVEDWEKGRIEGKVAFNYISADEENPRMTSGWIAFSVSVSVRDGLYRYTFTDFRHEGGEWSFGPITLEKACPVKFSEVRHDQREWDKMKKDTAATVERLILSLKTAMRPPP